mgnify:CR=1 FL=1
MVGYALHNPWTLDAERIDCPVRIVWGTEDRLLAPTESVLTLTAAATFLPPSGTTTVSFTTSPATSFASTSSHAVPCCISYTPGFTAAEAPLKRA